MFEDLLAANSSYASRFAFQGMAPRAAMHFGLVTCMDSRIEPLKMLGLRPGDAKILRNAGGRVTREVLRSLVLATSFLGVTHIAVMHHTGCALAGRDDHEVRSGLGPEQARASADWEFLAMPDPDVSLAADVHAVLTCRALPEGVRVEGWRYDVDTGAVHRIVDGEGHLLQRPGGRDNS